MLSSFLKFIRGQNPNSTLCRQYKDANAFPNFHHTLSSYYSNAAFLPSHSIPAPASLEQHYWHETGRMWLQLCRWMGSVSIKWSLKALQEKSLERFISWQSQQRYSKKSHLLLEAGASHVNNSRAEQARNICRNNNVWQTLLPYH